MRELVLGPKRFTDLRAGLPNVSPDVLAQRLRELEQAGIVRRRKLPPPAGAKVYELTQWGQELEPVLLDLGRWGSRSPLGPEPPALGVDAVAVALKTMFDPVRGDGIDVSYQLRLGEYDFALRVAAGELELVRGDAEAPIARMETDPSTLAALLWRGYPLDSALAAGTLTIEGSKPAVARLMGLFPPSVPAPTPGAAEVRQP